MQRGGHRVCKKAFWGRQTQWGYFDVFKKSHIIRISLDTVMKDIRRCLVIKLEAINYQELLDVVQQITKDHNGQAVPMDLDAVDTTSNNADGCC